MAASRDCSSVGGQELRPGNDVVHEDILKARAAVKKGCCGGDWSEMETEAIDVEQEVDEVCEEIELADLADILVDVLEEPERWTLATSYNVCRRFVKIRMGLYLATATAT
jgi:hypothetical protein